MTNPVPIRTQIDQGIIACVATIPDLTHAGTTAPSIFFNPARTVQDSEPKPYGLILTEAERFKKENLYEQRKFLAEISVWAEADDDSTLYSLLVYYMALIEAAIVPAGSLLRKTPIIEVEPTGIAMDTLFYETGKGVGVSQYEITYRTAYGNPFATVPS